MRYRGVARRGTLVFGGVSFDSRPKVYEITSEEVASSIPTTPTGWRWSCWSRRSPSRNLNRTRRSLTQKSPGGGASDAGTRSSRTRARKMRSRREPNPGP